MNKKIIKIAIQMRQNSYAPYSNYKVGSAVEVISGEIIGGCNVESSSYGLTCCAERIALYNALSKGFKKFKSIFFLFFIFFFYSISCWAAPI